MLEENVRYGYMCEIDFEYELGDGGPRKGSRVYPTIEDLKAEHTCWEGCGIIKVKVVKESVIVKGRDYSIKDNGV